MRDKGNETVGFLMNKYAFDKRYPALLTPENVSLLSQIHELRGRCQVLLRKHPNETALFIGEAKAESIQALCCMSGFSLSNERMIKLTMDKTIPSSRNEQEVAGYRDAMRYIDQNQAYLSVCPRSIQQIYQVLHTFVSIHSDSQYRSTEACPIDVLRGISFRPAPSNEIADALQALCDAYEAASNHEIHDPLLLIPMFVLNFLCVCPYQQGMVPMGLLLMRWLFCRAGHEIGRYISLESLIGQNRAACAEAIQKSAVGWHENKNDDAPFVSFMLWVIREAYLGFDAKLTKRLSGTSKPDQVRALIKATPGRITKTEIMKQCPNIAQVTVQRALNDLMKSGEIMKISGGRYTSYIWNTEENEP